jgi:hypothetical protein
MTKLNLNKTAIAQFGDAQRARLRFTAGTLEDVFGSLQIRPTSRVSGKRLPFGEVLVDVKRMGFFNQIDLQAAYGERAFLVPTAGQLVAAKHGWLTLAHADGDTPPTVKAV